MTDKKIARYGEEGRGQGEGAEYTPWLKLEIFPQSELHAVGVGEIKSLLSPCKADFTEKKESLSGWTKDFPFPGRVTSPVCVFAFGKNRGSAGPLPGSQQSPGLLDLILVL